MFSPRRRGDREAAQCALQFLTQLPFGLLVGVKRQPGGRWERCNLAGAAKAGALEPWLGSAVAPGAGWIYQTRQEFAGYMGWPLVQPNALPNPSKFCTEPLTRHLPGE
jgi:hypothetical protein